MPKIGPAAGMTRVGLVIVPVLLALRRLRTRPLPAVIVGVAIAAAVGLIGGSSAAAAHAQEDNVRLRLSEARPDERSVQVVSHLSSGEQSVGRDAVVDGLFVRLGDVLERPHRVVLWHGVGAANIRLLAVDDAGRDVAVATGRLPAGPDEALVLAGDFTIGRMVALGDGVPVRIVGRGSIRPEALPVGSNALPRTPQLTSEALLVKAFEPPLTSLAEETGSSVATTAALDPRAVDATDLGRLRERLRTQLIGLERKRTLTETAAPIPLLDELVARGDVARERLLLVAGQAAALLVAFAAFGAAVRRRELEEYDEQLVTLGASRAQVVLARVAEAAVPALVGGIVGVAALSIASDALSGETLVAIAVVVSAAAVLLLGAGAPRRRRRFGVGTLELAAVTAFAMVVWQASTNGALDPEGIEAGERAGPVLLLLPALAFLASGVVLLRVLPVMLRLGERVARKASFGVRLAFLTAARRPAEAAAATTFLAVALGAALFALNYRATLDRQSHDEARFAAGAAWRVLERAQAAAPTAGPHVELSAGDVAPPTIAEEQRLTGELDVTPLTRFRAASAERPTPVLRLDARVQEVSVAGEELDVEVLAVPALRIPELLGWRDSFSRLTRAEIARRLRPRAVRLSGPRIAADAEAVRFWGRSDTQLPRYAVVHLLLPDEQRFVPVPVGDLTGAWRRLAFALPGPLRGAELVGIEFPAAVVPLSAPSDEGSLQIGGFEERHGGRWSALPTRAWEASSAGGAVDAFDLDAGPVRRATQFNLAGTARALLHPALPLPDALPGLVSSSAATAAVNGVLTLNLQGTEVRVRVAGDAHFFPTVVTRPSAFVVLDYDTLFAALNANQPGTALPSEAWFFRPQRASFLERLSDPPFRAERAVAVEPLTARLVSDPLAAGARDVLAAAAVAAALLGLLGLLLAVRSTLSSERLVLAEYEALGVRPATLARSTLIRLVALSLLGIAAGFVGALLAVRLIGALVAVTAGAGRPLPPIEPVVQWQADLAVVLLTAVGALAGAGFLARRALRETAARRLRA